MCAKLCDHVFMSLSSLTLTSSLKSDISDPTYQSNNKTTTCFLSLSYFLQSLSPTCSSNFLPSFQFLISFPLIHLHLCDFLTLLTFSLFFSYNFSLSLSLYFFILYFASYFPFPIFLILSCIQNFFLFCIF